MMFKRRVLKVLLVGLGCVCGCIFLGCGRKEGGEPAEKLKAGPGGVAPTGGPVVARYGDRVITWNELEYEIQQLPPEHRDKAKTLSGLQTFLTNLVNRKLLLEEIEGRPINPEVERQARLYRENLLIKDYLDQELPKRIVSDEMALKYYEENADKFVTAKQVRVAGILIKVDPQASEEDRRMARERIQAIYERAKKGEDFASLARQYSEDEVTAKRGGDMGYLTAGHLPPEVDTVIFGMKKEGEISGIVESRVGFHIFKLLAIKNSERLPFVKVKEQIKASLGPQSRREAQQQLMKELMAKKPVRIDNSVLLQMIAKESLEKTMKEFGISSPQPATSPVGSEILEEKSMEIEE